jgi:hypothetical protein
MRARSEIGVSNREISLDREVALIRRTMTAPFRVSGVAIDARYGMQILKPEGWVKHVGLLTRKPRCFGTLDQAMDACIDHWRKTGRAARPCKLD